MSKREIVIPGEKIAELGDKLPGENTEKREDGIYSIKYGLLENSEKLIKVIPLSGTYIPRRGNVVVGKVTNVTFNGWVIDISAPENGFLSLMEVPRYVSKDNLEEVLEIGDACVAQIWGINKRGIDLSFKSRGLGRINDGILVKVNPNKVPRIIGKEGSMIKLIKDKTNTNITVGQNGIIWVKAETVEDELYAKAAILHVSKNSFISGLTEEMEKWFNGGKK